MGNNLRRSVGLTSAVIILALLLLNITQSFTAQSKAIIYIRPDGSVEGSNVVARSGNAYTLTADIRGSIIVEKDNIVIDGAGHTLFGSENLTEPFGNPWFGTDLETALRLVGRNDVTVRNVAANGFVNFVVVSNSSNIVIEGNTATNGDSGISLENSPHTIINRNDFSRLLSFCVRVDPESNETTISANKMTSSDQGIVIHSSNNTITGNTLGTFYGIDIFNGMYNIILDNVQISGGLFGIEFTASSFNVVSRNSLIKNQRGIAYGTDNTIFENNIQDNDIGIDGAYNCSIYRNNFVNNKEQVAFISIQSAKQYPLPAPNADSWDNGTQGNYWSDYQTKYPNAKEANGVGTYDTPYSPYPDNVDNHPLVKPVQIGEANALSLEWLILAAAVAIVIVLAVTIGLSNKPKKRKNQQH